MAFNIPEALIPYTTSLHGTDVWIMLFEVRLKSGETIRFANNTEDIVWNEHTWYKCYFVVDDINEDSKSEVPALNVKLPNVDLTIQSAIENINGGVGSPCVIYIVNSENLDITQVPNYQFEITGASLDSMWATFTLGAHSVYRKRIPQRRLIKNFCPFTLGDECCKYSGSATTCNQTLARCRELGNSANFGGFPGVGVGSGFYA